MSSTQVCNKPDKILCQPLRLAILKLLKLGYEADYLANLVANALLIMLGCYSFHPQ